MTRRAIGATVAAAAIVLAGAPAWASPAPSWGPTTGGTTVQVPAPVGLTFTQISSGAESAHSLAIGSDGDTYAWGYNASGQLGDGTTVDSGTPVQVLTPSGVAFIQVSAGGGHSLAVGTDGNAYAWGDNGAGQLGDGSHTSSPTPVLVPAPAGVAFTQVSAGGSHSMAIGSDGNTYTWGYNASGQLGDGTHTDSTSPVQVSPPAGVAFTQISAGGSHSMAIGSDGNAYAWGGNWSGQLGDGTNTGSAAPVQVVIPGSPPVMQISAGGGHSLAIVSPGYAFAWGANYVGQLGNGSYTDSNIPVMVALPALVNANTINAGNEFSLAAGSDGNTYTWGYNVYGQLGDGTNTSSATPVPVAVPGGLFFSSTAAGAGHALAIGSDGNTYAWGWNSFGQLGDGSAGNRSTPAPILPSAVVTVITFGGAPGTGLVEASPGLWEVATPPHATGTVDVAVEWTLNGVPQAPVLYPGGFTYTDDSTLLPVVSDPVDVQAEVGETAVFSVTVTSALPATVEWEFSCDGGATWDSVASDPAVTVALDGLSIEVLVTAAHDGCLYRATATSRQGSTTSAAAALTVISHSGGGGTGVSGTGSGTPSGHGDLPVTGATTPLLIAGIGATVLLALGIATLVANRAARDRFPRSARPVSRPLA